MRPITMDVGPTWVTSGTGFLMGRAARRRMRRPRGFRSANESNQIGWVPLGPGDSYAPRYYDANWQPYYLTRTDLAPTRLVNYSVANAVTVVPVDYFGRPIDPRMVTRVNPQLLTQVRPTLDPLLLTPLRNAVVHSAWGRGKIDLPPGIAKKLNGTPVFVGSEIRQSRFRKDLAKSLRVERVSDNAKNQKFKVKDERQAQQVDDGRKQEIDRKEEAAKGIKEAPGQVRKLEQQQPKANPADKPKQEKAQRKAAAQPHGEQVANPAKQQSPGASKKEAKHESPAKPQGGAGAGKGKGKKP